MSTSPLSLAASGVPLQPWRALLDALDDAAWIVQASSTCVVAANARACQLLGHAPQELLGSSAASLLATPEDLSWWETLDEARPSPL